jgi:hypothetical protein
MKKLSALSLCFTILLLGGCATGIKVVNSIPDAKRVLVISALGDKLNLQHIGTTVFTNKEDSVDVGTWHLNEAVEENFLKKVSSRFTFFRASDVPFRKAMGQLKTEGLLNWGLKLRDFKSPLYDLARSEKADYILIFGARRQEDLKYRTSVSYEGYGIVQRSILGASRSSMYAHVCSTLLDVASQEEVAWACGSNYWPLPVNNPLDDIPAIKNTFAHLDRDDFAKFLSILAIGTSKQIGIHNMEASP